MLEIGAFEAKTKFGALLDRVERGEEIIITRRGQAVARLMPNFDYQNTDRALAAATRIRQRAQKMTTEKMNWDVWKKYRDEGRE